MKTAYRKIDVMINQGAIVYPPSVLVIEDNAWQDLALKQKLERNNCRVQRAYTILDAIKLIRKKYIDLIVLNLNATDQKIPNYIISLKSDPELKHTPIIVLISDTSIKNAVQELQLETVYCLHQTEEDQAILLQIIKQIHYMTYRYS